MVVYFVFKGIPNLPTGTSIKTENQAWRTFLRKIWSGSCRIQKQNKKGN